MQFIPEPPIFILILTFELLDSYRFLYLLCDETVVGFKSIDQRNDDSLLKFSVGIKNLIVDLKVASLSPKCSDISMQCHLLKFHFLITNYTLCFSHK